MEIETNNIEYTGIVQKILDQTRLLLFKSVYLMLRDEEQNTWIVAATIIIQGIQLLFIPFNDLIYHVWQNDDTSELLNKLLGYFRISSLVTSFNSLIILMYTLIGYLMFVFMMMLILNLNNRQAQLWPIYILRTSVYFLITIFYMPSLDIMFKIIQCVDVDNINKLKQFPSIQCWSNEHVVHGAMVIVGLCLLIPLCIFFSLLYYENNYRPQLAQSRKNGRPFTMILLYKSIMVICYTFMEDDQFDYFFVFLILVGSFTILYFNHVKRPYNHRITQTLWSIILCINMWTVTLLAFALFLEGIFFFGLVYASIGGIPFIIYYIINVERKEYQILMINSEKSTDPYQTIRFNDYVIGLLHNSSNQRNSLFLDTFIEMHKNNCQRRDCYLLSKMDQPKTQKDRDYDIICLLGQIYFTQVKSHPNNVDLRIGYCKFLIDYVKVKQQVTNELNILDQLHPTLDQEFIIYRLRALIQKENLDLQNQNQQIHDFVSSQAFKLTSRTFQAKLERITLLSMDFWSILQEDNPNLTKLNNIGHKIFDNLKQVDMLWSRMNQKSYYYPKIMRLYAKFLIEVLQDKEAGESLMLKAKEIQAQINLQKDNKQIHLIQEEDIQYEPLPLAIISANSDKLGLILNVNQSFANLSGYFKSEIINRKFNFLMPQIFQKHHEQYMDNFLNEDISNKDKFLMKERIIFIKLKSNYIIPVTINLKIISQQDDSIVIATQYRLQKFTKPQCYFILDQDDVIDSISSSCIPYMNIESKSIQQRKTQIKEIIKNFPQKQDRAKFQSRGERVSFLIEGKISSIEHLQTEQDFQFLCQIKEIQNNISQQPYGYIVRLEQAPNESSLVKELRPPIKDQQQNFQLKFNPSKAIMQGQWENDGTPVKVDQSILWEQIESSFMSQQDQVLKSSTQTDQSEKKKAISKYSDGIRTLRLQENRIQEIEDNEISEDEEMENKQSILQGDEKNQDDDQYESQPEQNNLFRSRSYLNGLIENEKQHSILNKFNWVTNIIILGVIVISFIDYFLTVDQYQQIERLLNILLVDNYRNTYIGLVITQVQNLVMLNRNITFYPANQTDSVQLQMKQQLNESITQLNQQINYLMLRNVNVDQKLNELYTQNVVNMQISENQTGLYDFFQAHQQVISRAIIVYNKNLSEIRMNDRDVRFVIFNLQNGLLWASRNSCTLYSIGFKNSTIDKKITFQTLLGVAMSIILLGFATVVLLLFLIFDEQENMLKIFLQIPERTTKFMYKRSENFISSLQQGEEDDAISDLGEFEKLETDINKSLSGKKKKKKYKISKKDFRNYVSSLAILILIFSAYFIFNFFMSQTLMDNISQQVNEINATTRASAYYRFTENAQRTVFLNRSWTVLQQDSYRATVTAIDGLYILDSLIHQEHALNQGVTNPSYQRVFEQMFMNNPCPYLITKLSNIKLSDCTSFAEGAVSQGMAVALARYFETIRYMQTVYDQFWGFPQANFTAIAKSFTTFRNITRNTDNVTNFILNLNEFNLTKEARSMQMTYIKALFEILLEALVSGIDLNISDQIAQKLALFIVFQIFMFILYFVFYLPLYMKFVKDLTQTRTMITIVPVKVIKKVRQIRSYVKQILQRREFE